MGVLDGSPVNASNTNAAFLNKNEADTMPFPLAFTSYVNFPQNIVTTSGTINALDSSMFYVKLTGSGVTINGAVAGSDGQFLTISNYTGGDINIVSESGSASASDRFNLSIDITLSNAQAAAFIYDSDQGRWVTFTMPLITSVSGVPTGAVMEYGAASAPSGWLLCDGSAVSRTTYSSLFSTIGTTYGAGNGTTTFNVPDRRNVFARGSNASTRTIGGISYPAVALGTTVNDTMQGHVHPENRSNNNTKDHSVASNGGGSSVSGSYASTGNVGTTNPQVLSDSPYNDGTNGAPRTGTETVPVYLGMNFIIKT